MQVRKVYQDIKPELLYDEIRDLVLKQGLAVSEAKLDTYSLPNDSSSFISRGTLSFHFAGEAVKECLRAHIVGSAKGETKLMIDIMDGKLFSDEMVAALQNDLDFILSAYEAEPE
ncbi:MAG: hypothetical protein PHQ86_04030 [Dehalococcoidales bacterium]|nr:hypothetical protein [Dehalococcoidales bacterium]